MDQDKLRLLLERYHRHECSKEEEALLDSLFESYTRKNQWRNWEHENPAEYETDLLASIKEGISSQEKKVYTGLKRDSFKWVKAVAWSVLVLLTGFAGYFYSGMNTQAKLITKTTQKGQKSNIVLSDGTMIRLNSESSLIYPEVFKGGSREVTLVGEAFFEVTKNKAKPFIVHSADLNTTVLGTSFNIKAFENEDIEVTVVSGRVNVSLDENYKEQRSPILLIPDQQAIYSAVTNTITTATVEANYYSAWKDGIIHFNDVSLKEAMQLLERWFNVTVNFENEAIGDCFISGKYMNENLVNILESITYVKKIEYGFQQKNQILITGDSCEP